MKTISHTLNGHPVFETPWEALASVEWNDKHDTLVYVDGFLLHIANLFYERIRRPPTTIVEIHDATPGATADAIMMLDPETHPERRSVE